MQLHIQRGPRAHVPASMGAGSVSGPQKGWSFMSPSLYTFMTCDADTVSVLS
jgi:hypothetical protein